MSSVVDTIRTVLFGGADVDVDVDRSPERIRELYWDRGLPQADVGAELDRSKAWVSRQMAEHGIPTRSNPCRSADYWVEPDHPRHEYLDWLSETRREDYRACVIEGVSTRKRAEERGVEPQSIISSIRRSAKHLDRIYDDERSR